MRRALIPSLALSLASAAFAGAGKDGFEVLSLELSPRQAAMSGAASAAAVDADAAARNPGAAAFLRAPEASLSHAALPLSVAFQTAAYAHPVRNGTWTGRISFLSVDDIAGYDDGGARTGALQDKSSALSLGYARRLAGGGGVGLSIKQVSQTVAGTGASVIAGDAGWAMPLGRSPLRLSLAVRNLGGKAEFVDERTPLPRVYEAGLSYRGLHNALVMGADLRRGSDGRTVAAAGAEGWVGNALALRAGYDSGRDAGGGLAVGAGFRSGGLRVDYAFLAGGDGFDPVHRLGLSYRFRGPGDRSYQEGLALSQKGNHAEAIYKFKEAIDEDPGLSDAVRGLREAVDALERQAGGVK